VPPTGYQVRVPKGTKPHFESIYASLSASQLAAIERAAMPRPEVSKRCVRRGRRLVCSVAKRKVAAQSGSRSVKGASKARLTKPERAKTKVRMVRTGHRTTVVASSSKRSRRAVD
jgi:hypothetical protein